MIHTVKGFSVVNKVGVDFLFFFFFLGILCFLYDPTIVEYIYKQNKCNDKMDRRNQEILLSQRAHTIHEVV